MRKKYIIENILKKGMNKKRKSSKKKTNLKKSISFKFLFWLIPALAILTVLTIEVVYYSAYNSIQIDNVNIVDIQDFSLDGFSIIGKIDARNPSSVDLTAKQIKYTAKIGNFETSDKLYNINLPKKTTTTIDFNARINWGITTEIAKDFLTRSQTILEVKGEVIMLESPIYVSVPFETQIDLKDRITDIAIEKAVEVVEDVVDTVVDTATNVVNNIVDGIKGLFS